MLRKVLVSIFLTLELSGQKKALIFGVTGQDGAYLTDLLLSKGYKVFGVRRRDSNTSNLKRLDWILKDNSNKGNFFLRYGDLSDGCNAISLIKEIAPDEIYNLAAQSHVKVSFFLPEYTSDIDALGTTRILEAIRILGLENKTKFYQASSSEMYGKVIEVPQNEKTPFYPRSPYAVAKVYSFWITVNYREAYGIFACNGILFNHESPLRGDKFVTKKITQAVARIKRGEQERLYLGNLDAKRDWGYAKDYVEAMWLMLQQSEPNDYVISTGEAHSVREFTELAFKEVGIDVEWHGEGVNEIGVDRDSKKILVSVNSDLFRPTEVDYLLGDCSFAKKTLGWRPKISFRTLVELMMQFDLKK